MAKQGTMQTDSSRSRKKEAQEMNDRWIQPTEIEKGWTAGVIDGEGTITVTPRKRTDVPSCRHEGFQCSVRVANTDVKMIEKLKQMWGGSTGITWEKRENRQRICYWWLIAASKALAFLNQIEPHLVTKKVQANIVLILQNRITGREGYQVTSHIVPKVGFALNGSALTEEENRIRCSLYYQIKILNRRGGLLRCGEALIG